MASDPNQPSDSISFSKFSGLKNTVGRTRLAPDELEVAKNVDIDDVGQLRRRRGYDRVALGDYHSLFKSDDNTVYGVKEGTLGIINPDFSFRSLGTPGGAEPIAYVQIGPTIYFSSEDVSGKIDTASGTVSAWGQTGGDNLWHSPVVNPVDGLPPIKGKLLGKPPLATALAYYNGRIYLAHGRTVWATELYMYDYIDKTKNYMFYETDVTVLAAVSDGLYVGTENGIWFQTGPLNEMRRVSAAPYAALRGSAAHVPAEAFPEQLSDGGQRGGCLIMTTQGLCAAMDSGKLVNVTQNKVVFPEAIRVNSLFRMQDGVNQYVGVADSGGSPTSSARIGDYVDAEIRRFQGA